MLSLVMSSINYPILYPFFLLPFLPISKTISLQSKYMCVCVCVRQEKKKKKEKEKPHWKALESWMCSQQDCMLIHSLIWIQNVK